MFRVQDTKGSPVDELTVKALLKEFALRRCVPGEHRFCANSVCDVVYFDAAGQTFTTADLRVPVWQKQPVGARTVCYCFGENETDIEAEIQRIGTSRAVEVVVNRSGESAGYQALVRMGMEDMAFEAVVLRHPDLFSPQAVARSKERLHGRTRAPKA